jgi:hypothetical protein
VVVVPPRAEAGVAVGDRTVADARGHPRDPLVR